MQGNRAKNTKPELVLRRALWRTGIRGYRVNVRKLPGTPDIAFIRRRIAVFVHGCFWHGCPHCNSYRLPKTNTEFWRQKLEENVRRDERANEALVKLGFSVILIWECQVEGGLDAAVKKVHLSLGAP
jgi:DNA mismatch endonuclease (patch repair protein)